MKKKKIISYILINILICILYLFLNFNNFKIYNGVDLRFTINTNFTRSAFFNVDLLSINESNTKAQFIKFPIGEIKRCLISSISNIHPLSKDHTWELKEGFNDSTKFVINWGFSSNKSNSVDGNNFQKCINSNYNEHARLLLRNKIEFLQNSIDIVQKYEEMETDKLKIDSVVTVYGLPYLNQIRLEELKSLVNMSLMNEDVFIYIDNLSSFALEEYKSKIEILISILIMSNLLTYSFFIIDYSKLNSLKRKIFK